MNETEPIEIPTSPCCRSGIFYETIYLSVPRIAPGEGMGRRDIGKVRVCQKCCKPCGEPRFFFDAPKGMVSYWSLMEKNHPKSPFYFVAHPTKGFIPET